ncbi:MAG TPA: tetratricopeptide repeat protein [Aggregatilineales bacterium]|nr:tetratricopeptide repeat protein [Aggregatilineales bacterium]
MSWLEVVLRGLVVIVCVLALQDARWEVAPQAIAAGDQAIGEESPDRAIAYYERALEAQPGDSQIIERLINGAYQANRPDLAHQFVRLLSARPTTGSGGAQDVYRRMADLALAENNSTMAAFYWWASLSGGRQDVPALRQLAGRAIDGQDWTTALDMLTRLLKVAPNDGLGQYELGLTLLPTDSQTAFTYLDQAAADPQYHDNVTALHAALSSHIPQGSSSVSQTDTLQTTDFQIGLTLMSLQAWPYAARALATAIERGNNSAAAYAFFGVTQDQLERDGWPMIQQALASAPRDPTVNYAAALHWRLVGDTERALAALSRAEALDPRNPAVAAEYGLNYRTLGRLDYAAVWYNFAVVLAPDNSSFRSLLARFYADTHYNLQSGGLDAIRAIANQYPNDPEVHTSLAWALFSTGAIDDAGSELNRALALDPTNMRAHFYLGIYYEYRGNLADARAAYEYVYQNPDNNAFADLAGAALKRIGPGADAGKAQP